MAETAFSQWLTIKFLEYQASQKKRVTVAEFAQYLGGVHQWRGLIGQADFEFKRDVLEALDVRVTLCSDDAGGRVVEVATALSLPRRFEYMGARAYQRRLCGEKP